MIDLVQDDLEQTLVSPVLVPRVHHEPVGRTALGAPADDLDGVTAESLSGLVLVDTRLVTQEVLIDSEGAGDGTILEDVLLDVVWK